MRGRSAGLVVLGAVLMLVLAALLEGFFRQMVQSLWIRYGVVFLTTALWVWYFGFVGRADPEGEDRVGAHDVSAFTEEAS